MARDVYVSWQGSRYSVPWFRRNQDQGRGLLGQVEVGHGKERIP